MADREAPTTALCHYTHDSIYLRDRDLVQDLIGRMSFTDGMFFLITGREASQGERAVVDAVLVTLMDHGLSPSATAARLVYSSAPEALQSGVAAGLLAVGSRFVGTMENCAALLSAIVAAPKGVEEAARSVAADHRARRQPVPGFGHHLHKPDDPRPARLFAVAEEAGTAGAHQAALKALAAAVDEAAGRHITINATGAIAAMLLDIGLPAEILRGFAVISRAAGLVAQIREEQRRPSLHRIWQAVEEAVPYAPEEPGQKP